MTNPTLESFVGSIRSLYQQLRQQQPGAASAASYAEIFTAINSHLDVFNENPASLVDNVLPVFALPEYTLPNMAVLFAVVTQLQQAKTLAASHQTAAATAANPSNAAALSAILSIDQEKLLGCVESCVELADEKQVEVASDIYAELCHFLTTRLCQTDKPKRGLSVIRAAIRKIQTDTSTGHVRLNLLTAVHCDLLQLALAAKNPAPALELLSHDVLEIHRPSTATTGASFDAKYLLSYFYYAGCVYTALKLHEPALFYFEQTLTVPATVVSQIMLEAYKKFLLVSLISKGKLPQLPKYTSRLVINQIKPMCSIYHELAGAFVSFDLDKLNALCSKYNDIFVLDKNLGLVKQLQHAFYKKNIQKLTKTFITLSLADMAQKVRLPSAREAELYMLNMIKDGEIFATINQKDGMVSFHDNPEKYDNPIIMEHLTKQMFECIQMDASIKEMDKEISTHPHYIQKCLNNSATTSDDGTDQLIQSTGISALRSQSAGSGSNIL